MKTFTLVVEISTTVFLPLQDKAKLKTLLTTDSVLCPFRCNPSKVYSQMWFSEQSLQQRCCDAVHLKGAEMFVDLVSSNIKQYYTCL